MSTTEDHILFDIEAKEKQDKTMEAQKADCHRLSFPILAVFLQVISQWDTSSYLGYIRWFRDSSCVFVHMCVRLNSRFVRVPIAVPT